MTNETYRRINLFGSYNFREVEFMSFMVCSMGEDRQVKHKDEAEVANWEW